MHGWTNCILSATYLTSLWVLNVHQGESKCCWTPTSFRPSQHVQWSEMMGCRSLAASGGPQYSSRRWLCWCKRKGWRFNANESNIQRKSHWLHMQYIVVFASSPSAKQLRVLQWDYSMPGWEVASGPRLPWKLHWWTGIWTQVFVGHILMQEWENIGLPDVVGLQLTASLTIEDGI